MLDEGHKRGPRREPVRRANDHDQRVRYKGRAWWGLPVGLLAGGLAGLFGTGGPPVIILLKRYNLDKGAFRATILWFFLIMSVLRGASYLRVGVLTSSELIAALWLLPASVLGMVLGMVTHRSMSERRFGIAVSVLLIVLGLLLLVGGGK